MSVFYGNPKRRITTVEMYAVVVLSSLLLSLEVIADAANFNWTTTSFVHRTFFVEKYAFCFKNV